MKRLRWYSGAAILCIGVAVYCAGCGMFDMDSRWRDREIVIDGVDDGAEWEAARHYFDEKQVTVGIMNDADDLFIRLSTRDITLQRQILMGGLTLWFTGDAGKEKTLGLHFPTGGAFPGMMAMQAAGPMGMRGGRTAGDMISPAEAAAMLNSLLSSVGDGIEITGPEKSERALIDRQGARRAGIDYAIAAANDNLVYEVRIPLHRTESHPYGISAGETVTVIGIGCETQQTAAAMTGREGAGRGSGGGRGGGRGGGMGGGMGGDMGGDFGGGMRGGTGGGMRGAGGGSNAGQTEMLELWMKTRLAGEE